MIPPDVASSLRQILPDQQTNATNLQTQPVSPTQRITDLLSDLAPGQRILAEIQALLPNGTYRAIAAQRNITLALPFSAKPGDTLELEVTESNGRLTLAFVADRSAGNGSAAAQESVSTTLSLAGKLIGSLIGNAENHEQRPAPAPLNASQPLVTTMPQEGTDLAPILKQALSQSGMFYEAHQARWVDGEFPLDALKQEPQGQLPPSSKQAHTHIGLPNGEIKENLSPAANNNSSTSTTEIRSTENRVPQEITTLVRQQLDGLATNNYTWQGQIWPGQQMQWEIGENPEHRTSNTLSEEREWQSRLKLSLPSLGNIDATLSLRPGGKIAVAINADSSISRERLLANTEQLQRQLSATGLEVIQVNIEYAQPKA